MLSKQLCSIPTFALSILIFAGLAASLSTYSIEGAAFLSPGENIYAEGPISLGDRTYHAVVGTAGDVFFFDQQAALVEDELTLSDLSGRLAAMAPAKPPQSIVLAGLRETVLVCKSAYYNFSTDVHVCIEERFFRFRCGYMWNMGVYEGIIDFPITEAKQSIESNLSILDSLSAQLSNQAGNKTIVSPGELTQLKAALAGFLPWHKLMLSYGPFAKDGGLSGCGLSNDSLDNLSDSSVSVDQKQIFESALKSLARAKTNPRIELDRARRDYNAYWTKLNSAVASFSSVRGATLDFAVQDNNLLSVKLNSLELGGYKVPSVLSDFRTALRLSSARLDAATSVMPAYYKAYDALSKSGSIIDSAPLQFQASNLPEQNDLGKKLSAAELELRTGSDVSNKMQAVSYDTALFYKKLAAESTNDLAPQGVSAYLVVGILVAAAGLAFGLMWFSKNPTEPRHH